MCTLSCSYSFRYIAHQSQQRGLCVHFMQCKTIQSVSSSVKYCFHFHVKDCVQLHFYTPYVKCKKKMNRIQFEYFVMRYMVPVNEIEKHQVSKLLNNTRFFQKNLLIYKSKAIERGRSVLQSDLQDLKLAVCLRQAKTLDLFST